MDDVELHRGKPFCCNFVLSVKTPTHMRHRSDHSVINSSGRHAAPHRDHSFDLLLLPDELVIHIAHCALPIDLIATVHLCRQCSRLLWPKLHAIWLELLHSRRLQWDADQVLGGEISGRTLTALGGELCWAVSSELPTSGISAWKMKLEGGVLQNVGLNVGICDASTRHIWFVNTESGQLLRRTRRRKKSKHFYKGILQPGFPDGNDTTVFEPCHQHHICMRGIIEVIFDADAGTLGFRVDDLSAINALAGFPKGAVVRPCVMLYGATERVRLFGPLRHTPSR